MNPDRVFHNIKDYGGNPGRIFISGHSAGCYLGDLVVMDKSYLAAHGIDANRIAGNISMSAHEATHFVIREAMGLPAHRTVVDALALLIPGTDHGGMVVPAFSHFLPFIRRVGVTV